MKILHIDTEKTWRGGEQQLLYLLIGLKEEGHEPTVICQPGSPLEDEARKAGINSLPVKMRSEVDLVAAWNIAKAIRSGDYDLVHTHTSHAHSIGLMGKLIARKGQLVVHRRVDFPVMGRFKYNFFNINYIAISDAIKNILIRAGISDAKIKLVKSCIDIKKLDNAEIKDVRSELGIGNDAIVIGNVAHMADHKGQIYLVRAAAIVKERYPDVRFVIVGDGELRSELESAARELELKESMIFTGFRMDVPSFLATFDIFAFPSHMEGLGTSVLDAMAFSKPVVSTMAGGIPEVVSNGINGILVPPKDPEAFANALIKMIESKDLRESFGRAGRRIVESHFSIDKVVKGTLDFYKELLSTK